MMTRPYEVTEVSAWNCVCVCRIQQDSALLFHCQHGAMGNIMSLYVCLRHAHTNRALLCVSVYEGCDRQMGLSYEDKSLLTQKTKLLTL